MSVPLYFNHHMPRPILDGLRARGIDIITAAEDGYARAADEALIERATQLGRVLVSEDKDFLVITDRWLQAGRDFAGFVYAPRRYTRYGQPIRDLELIAKVYEPEDVRNTVMRLPL